MNSRLVLLGATFCVSLILVLDSRRKADISMALWIPVIWLLILASRPVASWFSPIQQIGDLLQGGEVESPLDRNILLGLMALGVFTLVRRKLNWMEWLAANPWILLFVFYCGLSTIWSDFPGIAFKRWIRALGALIMIVIVLSERDPVAAIGALFRRCTYVLVPFSIVLYKYFRSMGVVYNGWTGTEYLIGVTTNKNALGRLCLIAALFMLWDLMSARNREGGRKLTLNGFVAAGMLVLTVWLLLQSKSSTSLGAFLLGSGILVVLGLRPVRITGKYLGTVVVLTALVLVGLDAVFNLKEMVIVGLGRDLTLTDRTNVWQDLLNYGTNPVFGVGYDSFWLGDRLENFIRKHQVAEAHSGYIEAYLEVGGIGLFFLAGLIWSVFMKAKRSFVSEEMFDYGRLRLAVLAIFLIYNLTEAGYKATTLMAFTLLVVALERPSEQRETAVTPVEWRPPRGAGTLSPAGVASRSRVRQVQP